MVSRLKADFADEIGSGAKMNEDFQFVITRQSKKRAVLRRVFREKKWRPLLISGSIFIILSFVGFTFLILFYDQNILSEVILPFACSFLLITGVILLSLVGNFTSRHIKDRLNEILYVKDGKLHQVFRFSVSGGYLQRVAGDRATEQVFDLKTIKNAKYDPASGRMELGGPQKLIMYSNYDAGTIREEHMLNIYEEKYSHVFYDYYIPGLYDYLLARGVKFEKGTISFSAFDRRP